MSISRAVTGSVSGKTTHLVTDAEAGPSKLQQAKSKGVAVISEDDLLELIRSRKPTAKQIAAAKPKPVSLYLSDWSQSHFFTIPLSFCMFLAFGEIEEAVDACSYCRSIY